MVALRTTKDGPDGFFGTADDAYGTGRNTTSDALGQNGLDVAGEACWLSVEPPLPDGQPVSVAQMPVHELTENPTVIDLGGAGTITMAPALMAKGLDTDTNIAKPAHETVATPSTSHAATTAAATQPRNLPSPSSHQVDTNLQTTGGKLSVMMILLIVALLAGSVMLSSAPASRVRRPISQRDNQSPARPSGSDGRGAKTRRSGRQPQDARVRAR